MPGERRSRVAPVVAVLLLAALVGAGVYWWLAQSGGEANRPRGEGVAPAASTPPPSDGVATVTAPAPLPQPVTPLPAAQAPAPLTPAEQTAARMAELVQAYPPDTPLGEVATKTTRARHPIEPPPGERWGDAPPDAPGVLNALVGRETVLSLLQTQDFVRRFVATIDSLGREHSPPMMWPVNPTEGRFTVQDDRGPVRISPDNGARYTSRVLVLESVNLEAMVRQYRLHYPSFQQTYEELGFPNRYFNDRLVQVIDQLLRTPAPADYPAVELPVIHGPVRPERPWVMYEFMDEDLAELTAGQKLMLRMGPVNMRRVKARLQALRSLVATPAAAAPQPAKPAPKR